MKTILSMLVLLTLVLTAVSCKEEPEESIQGLSAANFVFLKSIQKSNEANEQRSSDYSAPFEISKVGRNKEILEITVTFPEGCSDSRFELIWNGLTLESYPEIIFLYLRRTTDCKINGSTASRILTINLTGHLGDSALAQRVKVILCNTSKKANTENSDITVPGN